MVHVHHNIEAAFMMLEHLHDVPVRPLRGVAWLGRAWYVIMNLLPASGDPPQVHLFVGSAHLSDVVQAAHVLLGDNPSQGIGGPEITTQFLNESQLIHILSN
jgi:hypothetical protein